MTICECFDNDNDSDNSDEDVHTKKNIDPNNVAKEKNTHEYKICTLGDIGVGKTSLLVRYVENSFNKEYKPTMNDTFKKTYSFKLNKKKITFQMELYDTSGQDRYKIMRNLDIKTSDGYVLVFSITDPKSFEKLKEIHKTIIKYNPNDSYVGILVGNKSDLEDDRRVSSRQAIEFAHKINFKYIETSTKNLYNTNGPYEYLSKLMYFHSLDINKEGKNLEYLQKILKRDETKFSIN